MEEESTIAEVLDVLVAWDNAKPSQELIELVESY